MRASKGNKQTRKYAARDASKLKKTIREANAKKKENYAAWLALPQEEWSDERKAHAQKTEGTPTETN